MNGFKNANVFMREGRYKEAINLYKEIRLETNHPMQEKINKNIEIALRKLGKTIFYENQNKIDEKIKEEVELIEKEFDKKYYNKMYPEIKQDEIIHYCQIGWREHKNPNEKFSTKYYLDSNSDVKVTNINPFWHYLLVGKIEGRSALPNKNIACHDEYAQISKYFDTQYYLWRYKDIKEAKKKHPT